MINYEGYVAGPTTPTVPLHVDYFNQIQVPATVGVPVWTPMIVNLPIPGTIGQYAPTVLAVTSAAYARG